MDKIEILNGIIEENIEWFWNNDSIVDCETNTMNLWKAFKSWCMQNCTEVFDDLEESIIEKAIDNNFDIWIDKKIF